MKYRHWLQAKSSLSSRSKDGNDGRIENGTANDGGGELPPESKIMGWGYFAAIAFPISLFLFAWLSIPSIYWFASMIPLVLFGAASHVLFIMVSDYTVDS